MHLACTFSFMAASNFSPSPDCFSKDSFCSIYTTKGEIIGVKWKDGEGDPPEICEIKAPRVACNHDL